jgi:hypothetical protein
MDDYLSNEPKNFVDDAEKLYRLRRCEAQAKKLEFGDPKAEAEGSSKYPKESPPPSRESTSTTTDGRTTIVGAQYWAAMRHGYRQPTNLERRRDRRDV